MREYVAWIGLLALAAAAPWPASAQPEALRVERDLAADDCPDSAALLAKVRSIRAADAGPSAYTVHFSCEHARCSALIRAAGSEGQERSLTSTEPGCAALAQATAVTLALLYDADSAAPPPPPAAEARSEQPESRAGGHEPAGAPSRKQLGLSLGAAALIGAVRPFAPALIADASLVLEAWRFGLGALWSPRSTSTLSPGTVSETVWAGTARVCQAPFALGALRTELCAGATVGALHAGARGFTRNEQHTRALVALPIELALAYLGEFVGLEVSAGLWIPLTRHTFTIDGLHEAYRPPPLAAAIGARVIGLIPW